MRQKKFYPIRRIPDDGGSAIWTDFDKGMVGFQLEGARGMLVSPEKAHSVADLLEEIAGHFEVPDDYSDPLEVAETLRKHAEEVEELRKIE